MSTTDKKYLEAAAHGYVATSNKLKESETKANKRVKNLARIKLQAEALRYAAEFLDQWTGLLMDGGERKRKCKVAIDQLKELYTDAQRMLDAVNK